MISNELGVAAFKRGIGSEGSDLAFEPHDPVRIRLRRARSGGNPVDEIGVTDRPLKGLLSTHREADHLGATRKRPACIPCRALLG